MSQVSSSHSICNKRPLIIGLNPALQRAIIVNNFEVGSVNRGIEATVGIGGKGQNVFVAAERMGLFTSEHDSNILLAHWLGKGIEGDSLLDLIKTTGNGKGMDERINVRSSARLRTAITIVDAISKSSTEIIEPSGIINEEEVSVLCDGVKNVFAVNKASCVAVMGTMPPLSKNCPQDVYSILLQLSCDASTKVLLDTTVNPIQVINSLDNIGSPILLKVNARELCNLAKVAGVTGSESTEATDSTLIRECCLVLKSQISNQKSQIYVAVTDGPHSSHLYHLNSNKQYEFKLPSLHRPIVNTIGAGDAVASGSIFSWGNVFSIPTNANDNNDILNCFKWGLSCGASSCFTNKNSVFELEDAVRIYNNIEISSVSLP